MTDTSDLVEQLCLVLGQARYVLRDYDSKQPGCGFSKLADGCSEAATALTAKDKEIEVRGRIIDDLVKSVRDLRARAETDKRRVAELEKALRSALARIERVECEARAALKQSADALETAAARFNLMGGVGLVNGADPRVGYKEAMTEAERAARAVIKQGE